MSKLLIIDGSNLLFQMFFGMPARIVNAEGKAIQGTLGFVGAFLKIVRMVSPTHIVVLFDGETENPRKALDGDYKANREDYSKVDEEENPFSQLPDIYAALDALSVKHAETADCETDDLIAAYVHQYGEEHEILISSFDSDFFQLISDKVTVLRYRGENTVLCTPRYIEEKLGICPMQYADYKSLTGDSADNIKGADKVGPKTAAALLCEFGTLKELLDHAEEVKKPSVRTSLMNDRARLEKNYRLIKLEGGHDVPFPLEALVFNDRGMTTTEVLRKIGLK